MANPFQTVLGNLQALDPGIQPAPFAPPKSPLSKSVRILEPVPIQLLRDIVQTQSPRTGKTYKHPRVLQRAGTRLFLRLMPDGEIRLGTSSHPGFLATCLWGAREGLDFKFIP